MPHAMSLAGGLAGGLAEHTLARSPLQQQLRQPAAALHARGRAASLPVARAGAVAAAKVVQPVRGAAAGAYPVLSLPQQALPALRLSAFALAAARTVSRVGASFARA